MFQDMFRSPIRLGLLNLHDYEEDCTPSQERLALQRGSASFLQLDTSKADCKYMLRGVCKVDFPVFTKLTVINLNRSPAAGANIESIFMTQPNGIIKILIFLLRSRLEHSPRMRKVGCLNPRHDRPKW